VKHPSYPRLTKPLLVKKRVRTSFVNKKTVKIDENLIFEDVQPETGLQRQTIEFPVYRPTLPVDRPVYWVIAVLLEKLK
jgi:hypothetical protein